MSSKEKTLTIIGCGWLGLPLAKQAIQSGFLVKGSTTHQDKFIELERIGIAPYLVKLPDDHTLIDELLQCNELIINIPPGRKNPKVAKDYPQSIIEIVNRAKLLAQVEKIIFISSTSVYENDIDFIDESTIENPKSESGQALLLAENTVRQSDIDYNILRFGGLAGPGRHPGRFLAGRTNLPNGDQSINFLHQQDAIGSIMHLLSLDIDNKTYNIVSPQHPTKSNFYQYWAKDLGLQPPLFSSSNTVFKREISSKRFVEETGYTFKFPDPMEYEF